MTAVYPNDAVFNVNNFTVLSSVMYTSTGSQTEFALPSSVTNEGQVLPYADGILQDSRTFSLSTLVSGTAYANITFSTPLYCSNLTLKTISVPNFFYTSYFNMSPSVITYSNSSPVTIRGNTYVVNGSRVTFALPITANGYSGKDSILVSRQGINQSQDQFTYPSATLGGFGVDLLAAPFPEETVEIRYFDSGALKYTRKTSMADRKADRGFSYTREHDIAVSKFQAGYEKRRLRTRRLKRTWKFTYTNICGVEKEAFEAFYLARSGGYEAFSFDLTHLNEQGMVNVVFDNPPEISQVLSGSPNDLFQNFYTINVSLKEVDS